MRKAFTMLEIVVTIMIVGILAVIAKEVIPDVTLIKDTSYILSKIKETQSEAILEEGEKCFDIKSSTNKLNKQTIVLIKDSSLSSLCFDEEGKPYEDNISMAKLMKKPLFINITYKKEKKDIVVMPYSGLVSVR